MVAEDIQELKTAETTRPILDMIAARWSPRMFSAKAIGREDLKILLEAARWAPSSNNAQPWRFIYAFQGSRGYDRIFSCLSQFNKKWVKNAPILLLTAIKEKFDNGKENYHALHDLGLAVGTMGMQAESMGIALHQMAGVDWQKAHELFEVPEGFHVVTAIAIGYYGGEPNELPEDLEVMEVKERERKPLAEIAVEGKWAFGK